MFQPSNAIQKAIGRVVVVADTAHAYGATFDGKPVGSIADFSAFSFHAVKNFFIFAAMLVALHFCLQTYDSEWIELLVNGSIAVALSVVPCIAVVFINKDFRHYFKQLYHKIRAKFNKKRIDSQ